MDAIINMTTQYVVPVGCDNFRELITDADPDGKINLFVDKTYLIKEII